jgi:putative drug exporter of the RND superfamily
VLGRGLFWPFVPRFRPARDPLRRGGVWERIGRAVARRPRTVTVVAVLLLAGMGTGLVGFRFGLSQTEQLLGKPESVQAQALLDRSFSSGVATQTVVLAPAAVVDRAAAVARGVDGVSSVRTGPSAAGRTELDLALDAPPAGDAAFAIIQDLRSAYADEGGTLGRTLVGGTDATALDQRHSALRDQALVIPAILAIVFAILALLLRSLVAPVLLLASVLATYGASLGLGNLLFQHVFGFPAFDVPVPLYAFLFLVALGVDYNIFLTARAREERVAHATREGMVVALGATGGVITSAGVLLAAVFTVLGVLPVVALAQIGTLVGIGVLLDTLLVRTLLVPALVFLTGDRFWWPSRRPHSDDPAGPTDPVPEREDAVGLAR